MFWNRNTIFLDTLYKCWYFLLMPLLPPSKDATTQLHVNIPTGMHREAKASAARAGLKLRDLVVDAVRTWLNAHRADRKGK